jgi:hypothetical protein
MDRSGCRNYFPLRAYFTASTDVFVTRAGDVPTKNAHCISGAERGAE